MAVTRFPVEAIWSRACGIYLQVNASKYFKITDAMETCSPSLLAPMVDGGFRLALVE
jgi:hypothetical protein